jgi:hypothetical protein
LILAICATLRELDGMMGTIPPPVIAAPEVLRSLNTCVAITLEPFDALFQAEGSAVQEFVWQ